MLGKKSVRFGNEKHLAKYSVLKSPETVETVKTVEPEKSQTKKKGKVIIKVRGSVTEPKCWAARYFTKFIVKKAPERYEADVELLFEVEWLYMRRKLLSEGVTVAGVGNPMCAVWANDEYIGDDIGLGRFLVRDKHIGENILLDLFNVNVRISTDAAEYCPRFLERAYVYFNVNINGKNYGRMLFEIFHDMMPQSCERFLRECIRYNGCKVHRITHDGWFESGHFDKEEAPLREKRKPGMTNIREGMLSLVNYGRTNRKSSQFLVTFVPATFLDPYQCPIAALLDGIHVLEKLNSLKTNYDSPLSDVFLSDVNILYAPHKVVQRNNLTTLKAVSIRPKIWREQDDMKKEKDRIEEGIVWAPRLETDPSFDQLTDKLEIELNEIRLQLYKENKGLKEIINEPRFNYIIKNVMEKEKAHGKTIDFTEEEIRKAGDEKWFKILMNADSEFELYYEPAQVPDICEEWKDEALKKLSIIKNPTVLSLLQSVRKRELVIVLDIIKRLLGEAINTAVYKKLSQDIYVEPVPITKQEYLRPLGEEIKRLPESMQNILTGEVCNLTDSAFNLFSITLKQMLQNISETLLDDSVSTAGQILLIINATKSYLSVESLSEIEIEKRKESLIEDVTLLAESMMSVHRRVKSEPLPTVGEQHTKISTITF